MTCYLQDRAENIQKVWDKLSRNEIDTRCALNNFSFKKQNIIGTYPDFEFIGENCDVNEYEETYSDEQSSQLNEPSCSQNSKALCEICYTIVSLIVVIALALHV